MFINDNLNRRWRKANKKAKGGWSYKASWYAHQQQQRLLALEARLGTDKFCFLWKE